MTATDTLIAFEQQAAPGLRWAVVLDAATDTMYVPAFVAHDTELVAVLAAAGAGMGVVRYGRQLFVPAAVAAGLQPALAGQLEAIAVAVREAATEPAA